MLYRYLDLGGSEERGMRALAASYVGLPNMVNAMIELLHAAGYRKREIQSMVEEHLKSLVLRHFDPKKADLIFTEEGSVSIDMAKFKIEMVQLFLCDNWFSWFSRLSIYSFLSSPMAHRVLITS